MSERREPTISTYSPSKEEQARQQAHPGAPKGRPSTPTTQVTSSARSPAARPVIVKSTLAPFAFLFALVSLGAAGFLYWQFMAAQSSLAQANARIADLESKFEMTGDEVSSSAEAMQAKLKWADTEIRKLWGVSYDTNRKAIAENKERIEQVLKTATAAVDTKVKAATQGIAADLRVTNELVEAQQGTIASIDQKNGQIVRDYQAILEKLNGLETAKKELERRIQSNEQAIEAIDAFRRNVNQQLLELKGA